MIGGVLLFAAGLFLIGDRRMLFSDTFRFYAEFKQLAALDTGAKVRVSGIDAGEVEEIRVPTGSVRAGSGSGCASAATCGR